MNTQWRGQQAQYVFNDTELFHLSQAKGCRLGCVDGMILMTLYGVADDVTLRAGDSMLIPNHGLVLIEAIGGGKIALKAPPDAQIKVSLSWLYTVLRPLTQALRIPRFHAAQAATILLPK